MKIIKTRPKADTPFTPSLRIAINAVYARANADIQALVNTEAEARGFKRGTRCDIERMVFEPSEKRAPENEG